MPPARQKGPPRTKRPPAQTTALIRTVTTTDPASTSPQRKTARAQHEKLLQQVSKKNLAVSAARDDHSRVERQYAHSIARLQRGIRDVRGALQAEFTYFLGPEHGLSKRDRNKVRRLERELFDDNDGEQNQGDTSSESTEEGHSENGRGNLDEGSPRSTTRGSSNRKGAAPPQLRSAVKPSEQASLIRTLFRRLTAVLHPDRVQDGAEHARRTSLMQELNAAYASSNLATLLSLESAWLPPATGRCRETEADCIARLRKSNTELRRQLRGLTAELKELKALSPEASPRPSKQPRATEPVRDPLLAHLEEVLRKARRLREVARAFRERRITTATFIRAHYVGNSGKSDHEDDFSG